MEEKKTQLRVNWHDGMKLNKEHFIAADHYHTYQDNLTRRISLHENNFGLLPSTDNLEDDFMMEITRESNTLLLKKYVIRALMLNGMFVEVDSRLYNAYNVNADDVTFSFDLGDQQTEKYALILNFNSYEGIPFGAINSTSLPVSRPGIIPQHTLILEPQYNVKQSFFGEDFFIVAWLKIDKNDVIIDQAYIPPVTSILASQQLFKFYDDLVEKLGYMESFNLEIAKKYNKLVSGSLNDTILFISIKLMPALSALRLNVKHHLLHEPPLKLITEIMHLANIFNHCLVIRTGIGKDNFLNEVNRILGVSKKDFESMLKDTVQLKYKHYDIAESISLVRQFIDSLFKLLQSLSESDKQRFIPDVTIRKSDN